jgi:hypothetical protein
MTVLTLRKPTSFRLDPGRLAAHSMACGAPRGFDNRHPGGFAAAVAARFAEAWEAGAIVAPPQVRVVLYALAFDALMVAVRENDMPPGVSWPLRQVATVSFEADEVAVFGDESFAACCNALREVLRRAEDLVPALDAIAQAVDRAA